MLIVGLINSNDFKHPIIGTCLNCLLQSVNTSPVHVIPKLQLKLHSASLFSTSILITLTLTSSKMSQTKVNRELANLGVKFTDIDTNKGYAA